MVYRKTTAKQVETKLIDVFTKDPFQGNSLVVVLYGENLSLEEKINIIREMNALKGVFIADSNDGKSDFSISVYSQEEEKKIDYQSLIGAAHIMTSEKHITLKDSSTNIITENTSTGIFPLLIDSKSRENPSLLVMLDWNEKPEFRRIEYDAEKVANSLGLLSDDIRTDFPLQAVKMGHWALIVPIKSKEILDKVILNQNKIFNLATENKVDFICLFYKDSNQPENKVFTRVFNPTLTFQTQMNYEDTITGESNPCIAAYLFEHKLISISGSKVVTTFIQKAFNKRLGEIIVEMVVVNDSINEIYIGGNAITVLDGKMRITPSTY